MNSIADKPIVQQQSIRDALGDLKNDAVNAGKNAINSAAHLAIDAGVGYLTGRAITYIVGSVIMPEIAAPIAAVQFFMPEVTGMVGGVVTKGVTTAVGKAGEMLGSALKTAVTAALHL